MNKMYSLSDEDKEIIDNLDDYVAKGIISRCLNGASFGVNPCEDCQFKYSLCSEVWAYKSYKLLHRAEVAERALQIAEELGELCAPAQNYIDRAEKELAEGNSNGKG